jgi:cytosine/creatinine deaminase
MSSMLPQFSDIVWPDGASYWIGSACVPLCLLAGPHAFAPIDREDGAALLDILIEDGRIVHLAPAGTAGADQRPRVDLRGRQVWPMLVDVHTHLDRGHTVVRSPNASGMFADALKATAADRLKWTHDDLIARMDFGLRCAYAHGVSAIRTHLDSVPEQAPRSWQAFRDIRAAWQDRVALQAVSLLPIDFFRGEWGDRLATLVAESGGILGAVTRAASAGGHGAPLDDLDALLDRLFGLAARHDLDIDLHVDETNDPKAAALPYVARAALRHDYQDRVTCGHCCSLAVQPDVQAERTLDLLAEARVAVVTLPTVNLYLQDRGGGRTPRWRGVTLVHEMRKRGVVVAAAGDNCRDCFYAYGDHDMIDTFRQAVRILHLDHPLADAPALVGPAPAKIAKLPDHGRIAAGGPARLIVFNARTLNEIVSRHHADRIVIDRGRRSSARVPDYSELWDDEPVSGSSA